MVIIAVFIVVIATSLISHSCSGSYIFCLILLFFFSLLHLACKLRGNCNKSSNNKMNIVEIFSLCKLVCYFHCLQMQRCNNNFILWSGLQADGYDESCCGL